MISVLCNALLSSSSSEHGKLHTSRWTYLYLVEIIIYTVKYSRILVL
jgi:hypothetical protein